MRPKARGHLLWVGLFAAILVPFAIWGEMFEAYGASLLHPLRHAGARPHRFARRHKSQLRITQAAEMSTATKASSASTPATSMTILAQDTGVSPRTQLGCCPCTTAR